MKLSIAALSCATGITFGSIGAGVIGALSGAVTGFALGFAYMVAVLRFWEPRFRRIVISTVGGMVVGSLSGISVHVPEIFGLVEPFWGDAATGIMVGGLGGLCVGTVLGVILCIIFMNTEIDT